MNIVFTGTSSPIQQQHIIDHIARTALEAVGPDDCAIVGGCVSVDTIIARTLFEAGRKVHAVIPGVPAEAYKKRYYYEMLDLDWSKFCTSYELMPAGTGYMLRNRRMIELGARLVGFPWTPEIIRSGTWATIRYGRKKPIPCDIHILESLI